MRITAEILNKLARDTVTKRTQQDRGILAVYQQGSLLYTDPVIGGAADIDLFFIHLEEPPIEREIVRISDDVTLDIAHHARARYRQTRELRRDPWLGPTLNGGKLLYDPQHFLDFSQASVRGQFYSPENVIWRARSLVEEARSGWVSLYNDVDMASPSGVLKYLSAVYQAANAVASLSGPQLPVRRFLIDFPARAEVVGQPGFYQGLLGLLGSPNVTAETLAAWLPSWKEAYESLVGLDTPASLHHDRLNYYYRALDAFISSDHCQDSLWILLKIWTQAVSLLPAGHKALAPWASAVTYLGLDGSSSSEKLEALDLYLDRVEETLESWAGKNGVSYQEL